MGSRFANEKRALQPIVQQLKNRGLMMLDTRISPFSVLVLRLKKSACRIRWSIFMPIPSPIVAPLTGNCDSDAISDKKNSRSCRRPTRYDAAIEELAEPSRRTIVLAPLSAVATVEKTNRDGTSGRQQPFRPCVGILLINSDGKIFVGAATTCRATIGRCRRVASTKARHLRLPLREMEEEISTAKIVSACELDLLSIAAGLSRAWKAL